MKEKIKKNKLSQQEIGQHAIKEASDYYKKDLGIILIERRRGEHGFDLKYPDNSTFLEVKGTTSGTMMLYQLQLTNLEYLKAEECMQNNIPYIIHIVTNIGSDQQYNYSVQLSKEVLSRAKPEKRYRLPIERNDYGKYRILRINEGKTLHSESQGRVNFSRII